MTPSCLTPPLRCSLVARLSVGDCYIPASCQVHVLLDEDRPREQDVPTGSDAVWAETDREKEHTRMKHCSLYFMTPHNVINVTKHQL